MQLLERIYRFVRPYSMIGRRAEDPEFRCIKCGAEFERRHRTCPECGDVYVVPIDADDQS